LLKRTTINFVNDTLSKNTNWKILDIGCGYRANKYASVIADVLDLSDFYKEKRFIKINEKRLPFKDKEFDFVIASHVIEHVEDFEFFLKELERMTDCATKVLDSLKLPYRKIGSSKMQLKDIFFAIYYLIIVFFKKILGKYNYKQSNE